MSCLQIYLLLIVPLEQKGTKWHFASFEKNGFKGLNLHIKSAFDDQIITHTLLNLLYTQLDFKKKWSQNVQ